MTIQRGGNRLTFWPKLGPIAEGAKSALQSSGTQATLIWEEELQNEFAFVCRKCPIQRRLSKYGDKIQTCVARGEVTAQAPFQELNDEMVYILHVDVKIEQLWR